MPEHLTDLTVELTQRCVNRCLFCSSSASLDSCTGLRYGDVLRVAEEAAQLGLTRLSLSGGEPLLVPWLLDLLADLSRLQLHAALYTCGIRLDPSGATVFEGWDRFKKAAPSLIFNVQSTDPAVHDHLVGRPGALALTLASLRAARDHGLPIEIHVVPNKINMPTLTRTATELADLRVERISFLRLVPQGTASTNATQLCLDDSDHLQLRNIFSQLAGQADIAPILRFGIPFGDISVSSLRCNAGTTKLIVRYDGKILPCEAFKADDKQEFVLGDIRHDTLKSALRVGCHLSCLEQLKRRAANKTPCPAQYEYMVCGRDEIAHDYGQGHR